MVEWKELAPKFGTVWFMFALAPLMVLSAIVCSLILLLAAPLTAYAFVTKSHLKSPWAKSHQKI